MKSIALPIAAIILAGSAAFATNAILGQAPEMPKPLEQHKMLHQGIGEFHGTITMFMPGMPETPSAASETVVAMGPFWTRSEFKSSFMGMEYNGFGNHGFDAISGKYTSTWADNMSSYLSIMTGELNKETGVMTSTWDAPNMMGVMEKHRSEARHGKDGYVMTFYTGDTKTMVIDMKRKMDNEHKGHDGDKGHDADHDHKDGEHKH